MVTLAEAMARDVFTKAAGSVAIMVGHIQWLGLSRCSLAIVLINLCYSATMAQRQITTRQQTDSASDFRVPPIMTEAASSDVTSGSALGKARQTSQQLASQFTWEGRYKMQTSCCSFPPHGLRKREESMAGLAAVLAVSLSQLATAQGAGCLTTDTCKALNPSMAVEQSLLGLLPGAPVIAQAAAPAQPTITPGNSMLTVRWEPPAGYADSQTIDYDIQYSEDGGSTWWPWHIPSQLKSLTVNILGLQNGTTYVVRVRAKDSRGYGQWSALASAMPVGVPAAPGQLDVMPGDQQLKLSWLAPVDHGGSEIIDYDVQYSNDGGATQTLWHESPESTNLSEQMTNLNNGTTYHLRVRARNEIGHGPWSDWAPGQPATVPAAPNPPTLTPGNRQLRIHWDAPSNDGGAPVDGYDIRYSSDRGTNWNTWYFSADSQHPLHTTIAGLNNDTTYTVQVRAQNDQGHGPWSASALDQPLGVPVAPGRPILTPGNRELHVRWDAPSDDGGTPISSYDIRYSNDNGFTWQEWDASIDSQSLEATITGLQNSLIYHVQVRAGNSQGDGAWSLSALDRPAGVPGAPTGLTLMPRHHQLEVRWDPPADNGGAPIGRYDIQYSNDRGSTWRPWYGSSQLDNLRANILGLNNGITYAVRVRAGNSQGDGPWSTSASATPVGLPAAPTQLNLIPGDRMLKLNWIAPVDDSGSGIIDYSIQYSEDRGSTWSQWDTSINAQRLQETMTGLQNGTLYHVQVRARNSHGDGPWSAWEEGRPATTPAAPAPPALTPRNRELRVNWDAPDDDGGARINRHDVRYSADGDSTWREWHTSADARNLLQTTIAGLDNGTRYAVQVRARNHQGHGPWSASALDQPVGVPTAPLSPTLTPGNGKLRVGWSAPSDNGGAPISGYDLRYSSDSGATWSEWDVSIDSQSFQETIAGLQNGTVYRVQVRAGNNQGSGPWSTWEEGQPRLLPNWIQLPLSGLIWPIVVALIAGSIASSFKINIRTVMQDQWSSLRRNLLRNPDKRKPEEKSDDPAHPKTAEEKDDEV